MALAGADQALTGARVVDGDHDLYLNTGAGGRQASLLMQPAVPRVLLSAVDGAATSLQVNKDVLNLVLAGVLSLNGDAGTPGQMVMSNGPGAPPTYGGIAVVPSATAPANTAALWWHTTDLELYSYDATRAKWLGAPQRLEYYRPGSTSATFWIQPTTNMDSNVLAPSRKGKLVTRPITITDLAFVCSGGPTSGWTFRLRSWDASADAVEAGYADIVPAGSYQSHQEPGLDYDLDALDVLGCACLTGGTSVTDPGLVITFRPRPSSGV